VRAKRILALLFQGAQREAVEEFNAFRKLHADAKGSLAGQEGNYAEILTKLASQSALVVPPRRAEDWTKFAGSSSRSIVVPTAGGALSPLPHLHGPSWVVRLELGTRARRRSLHSEAVDRSTASLQTSRSLAFYPIVVGDQVLISDARYVRAFDLKD